MRKTRNPDTLDTIGETDLVQLSQELLESVVDSTEMLSVKKVTPQRLTEMRVVLGYMNSATSAVKAKMHFFKLTGAVAKIDEVKRRAESLKKVSKVVSK